jgi:hypothetical protein
VWIDVAPNAAQQPALVVLELPRRVLPPVRELVAADGYRELQEGAQVGRKAQPQLFLDRADLRGAQTGLQLDRLTATGGRIVARAPALALATRLKVSDASTARMVSR